MYLGKPKTDSNIEWHRHQSATSRIDEELMQKSLRELSSATDPLDRLRLLCFSRGASGILSLGRVFRRMDKDGSNHVNKEGFIVGLKEAGIQLSDNEADELFERFDTEKGGSINLDEFITRIRPPMSETRHKILQQAFRKLDKDGHGLITVAAIRKLYSVTSDSRYKSGEDSADFILNKFLENFETEGTADGKVTLEEFLNFYSGISASIDTDCYFDLLMRQSYLL